MMPRARKAACFKPACCPDGMLRCWWYRALNSASGRTRTWTAILNCRLRVCSTNRPSRRTSSGSGSAAGAGPGGSFTSPVAGAVGVVPAVERGTEGEGEPPPGVVARPPGPGVLAVVPAGAETGFQLGEVSFGDPFRPEVVAVPPADEPLEGVAEPGAGEPATAAV